MAFGAPSINNFGNATMTDAAGAASDLLNSETQATGEQITAEGTRLKAEGDTVQGENYTLASNLSLTNEEFAKQSTAVQETMASRAIQQSVGSTTAEIAGSGLGVSGSGLDILRDSAQQGALQTQLVQQQGEITDAGYQEQAKSYQNLAQYSNTAAATETSVAAQQDQLAKTIKSNGEINAGIKAASAVATLFIAP